MLVPYPKAIGDQVVQGGEPGVAAAVCFARQFDRVLVRFSWARDLRSAG
jgi:hypothetical protein